MKQPTKKNNTRPAPRPQVGTGNNQRIWYYWLAALLVVTALIYSNALKNPILPFDDNEYFNDYPEILKLSFSSVVKYFSGYYVLMYQPIPILSFAIQYQLSGLNPLPLHLVNLMFHLGNIVLVFILLKKLSKSELVAFIAAALFAVHPMSVEAVTWISARSSVMYTCFYLLALHYYIVYLEKDRKSKYLIYTFLFFILSLFSKAQAVTLPVILIVIDYYYGYLKNKSLLLLKIPFLSLSLIFGIITVLNEGTVTNITRGMMIHYNVVDMFFMVCYSFAFYVFKYFFPFILSAIYVYPPKSNGFLPWIYYFSPVIMALIAWLVWKFRKEKLFLLAFAFFFFPIILNIQLIPSRNFIVADRYTYFPYIGFFLITGLIFKYLADNKFRFENARNVMGVLIVVYFALFSFTVFQRNQVWSNVEVFMTDIISKNPEVPYISRAYGTRGNFLLNQGRLEEAGRDFTKAVQISPRDDKSWFNRAVVNIRMSDYDNALSDIDSALKINPRNAVFYSRKGVVYFSKGDRKAALRETSHAISLDSSFYEPYNTRGVVRFMEGDREGGLKDLNRAVQLSPKNTEALRNRGLAYFQMGDKAKACADYQMAANLGDQQAADFLLKNCQ